MNSTELTGPAKLLQPVVRSKFELIQIFRGFAAILVITYHCNNASLDYFHLLPFKGIFYPGMFGVDFFFVLSGFIITYIHLNDLKKSHNWQLFLKKRFFRIYPIYWVFAVVTLGYFIFFLKGKPDQLDHTLNPASFDDWMYLIKSFALFPQKTVALVDVSWTLCFEVLFYTVFAICVKFGWKLSKIVFFSWIGLILLKSNGIINTDNFYVDFLLSPLIIEFLMGCVLAYVFRTSLIRLTLPLFISLSTALLIGAFTYLKVYHHQLGRDGIDLLLIISSAALLIWGSATIDKSNKLPGKKLKALLIIGDGSYSIYLTHTLVVKIFFTIASEIIVRNHLVINTLFIDVLFAIIALIAILVGSLLHLYVEKALLLYMNNTFLPGKPPPAMIAKPLYEQS